MGGRERSFGEREMGFEGEGESFEEGDEEGGEGRGMSEECSQGGPLCRWNGRWEAEKGEVEKREFEKREVEKRERGC